MVVEKTRHFGMGVKATRQLALERMHKMSKFLKVFTISVVVLMLNLIYQNAYAVDKFLIGVWLFDEGSGDVVK